MLRLLLDEHLSPRVATQLTSHREGLQASSLHTWQAGLYLGASDARILQAASVEGLTLVTYDQRTIPPLLMEWGAQGLSHAGVIFVDTETIRPDNIGGLVRGLLRAFDELGEDDWTNRVFHLERT